MSETKCTIQHTNRKDRVGERVLYMALDGSKSYRELENVFKIEKSGDYVLTRSLVLTY